MPVVKKVVKSAGKRMLVKITNTNGSYTMDFLLNKSEDQAHRVIDSIDGFHWEEQSGIKLAPGTSKVYRLEVFPQKKKA